MKRRRGERFGMAWIATLWLLTVITLSLAIGTALSYLVSWIFGLSFTVSALIVWLLSAIVMGVALIEVRIWKE